MVNIYEILKGFEIEIPSDKKAEFDKLVLENYKTIAETDALRGKLKKTEDELKETKGTLENTNKAFEDLKQKNASKEDWEEKYNELVADNKKKADEQAAKELELQERAEFDGYFSENKKEWANPMIADGYFAKFREAKSLAENKTKTTADILHLLTKDDATAFKTAQPIVNLKGASPMSGGVTIDKAAFDKMGYNDRLKLYNDNPELYKEFTNN